MSEQNSDDDDVLPDDDVCEKDSVSSQWAFVIGFGLVILLIFVISP